MAKRSRRQGQKEEMSDEVAFMKSVRKPPMPRPKVINPDNTYERRDKDWADGDGDDEDDGPEYQSWSELPYV